MSGTWLNRTTVAIGVSLAFHLLLFASSMPGRGVSASVPEMTSVELVPILLEPPRRIEPPLPLPEPPRKSIETPPRTLPRPRLAARLTPHIDALPTDTASGPEEPASEPPPEPTVEPEPVALPDIPLPREAARRRSVSELPPTPTDEEVVEGRVIGMMKGALRPRTNDRSPMPDLHLDEEGNLVHENGALHASIAPDGTVTFGRRRGGSIDGLNTSEDPDPAVEEILKMHTRLPYVPLVVRKASPGDCVMGRCDDKAGPGISFRPHSDLNDLVLRGRGEDPLAARKRRFLRLTQELRDGLASKSREHDLSRSKLRASRHVEKVWRDTSRGVVAKRRLLFRLWDECDEPLTEGDDRPEAKAGLRARSQILRFIRTKLPRGSPDAFTSSEVRHYNSTRRSQQSFRPY